jgi:hypothetical protein
MELLIGVISVCEFIDSANEILVDKTVVNIIDAITLAKIIFLDILVITLFSLKDLFQFIKGKN